MRATTYPESKCIGRIWRRWVEAVNEKCVAAVAGSSIHGNVLNAFVWWSINYPAQVVVVEGGGGGQLVFTAGQGGFGADAVDYLAAWDTQREIHARVAAGERFDPSSVVKSIWLVREAEFE